MNKAHRVSFSLLAACSLLAVACQEPAAPAAVPAPAPVAAPVEVVAAPAPVAAFDVRAFAGTFAGRLPCAGCTDGVDTRLDLNSNGTFLLVETDMVHPEKEPREIAGTWTAEENNTQVRLEPDTKAEAHRRFDIASDKELRMHTVDKTVAAGANTGLFRLATP